MGADGAARAEMPAPHGADVVGADRTILVIGGWHTECGKCRYGSGGWGASPAREGKPILTPESRTCPDCGVTFTHSIDSFGREVALQHESGGAAASARRPTAPSRRTRS